MRSNLLATAIAIGLGLAAVAPAHAADDTASQLAAMRAQITALQAQVEELQARTDAQSDVNVTQAQAIEAAQATNTKADALEKLVNNTKVSGRIFFDVTSLEQESDGTKINNTGIGFDVKRFYVGIDHKFDDKWSANITTDVSNVIGQLDQSIAELRRVSHNMMPEALIKYGLKEALENYCENINLSGSLKVQLQTYGMETRMDQNTEIVLYRIVQELLNNVIKHAGTDRAVLGAAMEDGAVVVTVVDQGRGFDPAARPRGLGLSRSVEGRVADVGGSVRVDAAPGAGTCVELRVPLPEPGRDAAEQR